MIRDVKLKNLQIKGILALTVILLVILLGMESNKYVYLFTQNNFMYFKDFPYPAFMKIVYYPIYLIIHMLDGKNLFVSSLIFALPIFISDAISYMVLEKLFKDKNREIMAFYLYSVIICYISYVKLELDIIAVSALMLSVYYLLKNKYTISAIILGLAFATKNPCVLALPIMLVYIYKTHREGKVLKAFNYLGVCVVVYLLISLPFIVDSQYINNALKANSIELLTATFFMIGSLKLYLAPAGLAIIYIRFIAYKKVNKQLFFDYLGLVYSIFVLCIEPNYNWYLWPMIFISVLFINRYKSNRNIVIVYIALSIAYIFYFLLGNTILKQFMLSDVNRNFSYTLLEIVLLSSCYCLYRFGIRSNRIYNNAHASFIIGIGGDSGAGKSTLISAVKMLLGERRIVQIEADGDHKWERGDSHWEELTHLNPKANFLYKQASYLKTLKNGDEIRRVEYNHDSGTFSEPIFVKSNDYILLAGLHPFYLPQTRRIVDLKIYLDTDENLRRHWKIIRDTEKRGYSKEKILSQIEKRMDDAYKYIYPQKQFSDIIIRYFSDDLYELGDKDANIQIKLQIKFSADVDFDSIIHDLAVVGADIEHEFDEDLKYQTIVLNTPIKEEDIARIVNNHIENIEEILDENSLSWMSSYDGFVQLVILLLITYKMRGEDFSDI